MDIDIICIVVVVLAVIIGLFISWIKKLKDDSKQLIKETALNANLKEELKKLSEELDKDTAEIFELKESLLFAQKNIRDLNQYIKNPPSEFPNISSAVADIILLQCKNLENYFIVKPHPSMKSADLVKELSEKYKDAVYEKRLSTYRLEYLLSLYPELENCIDSDTVYKSTDSTNTDKLTIDPVSQYLSAEEWRSLSTTERNQRALDNYINGHKKSKWQIGRDYELYIGFVYQNKGYSVDYIGSYAKFEDLGRDLICKKGDITLIIQCKYWSKEKQIHEKHINQLYGTTLAYAITHNLPIEKVKSVLITNIALSPMAVQFADILGVGYKEHCQLGNFPRIKCNINHDEWGTTKIYHLPMDQQYDRVQIKNKGEFFAYTVEEAENAGFRRAFKHHQ